MTREQFLNELRKALSAMKEDEAQSVIAYYDEMLNDRMEAGMSEEAAVDAMEPVRLIAARVLNEADVRPDAQQTDNAHAASKNQEIRRPAADVRQMHITAENKRIIFRAEDTEEIILRYTLNENSVFQLHEENGVLSLESHTRPVSSCFSGMADGASLDSLLDGIGKLFNSIGNTIVNNGDSMPIEVILPRVYWGAVQAESRNARITMNGVTCAQEIVLNTSNGRVELEDMVVRHASVHTSNGRIRLRDVYAREGIQAVSSNGSVSAERLTTDHGMRLVTSNANIRLEDVSGHDIDIRTSNGSVSGTVHGNETDYAIYSVTRNAGNNLKNSQDGEKTLKVVTSNGTINVSFVTPTEG